MSTLPRSNPDDAPVSARCLSTLLLDALRTSRARAVQLDHVRRKLAFTVDVAVDLGRELDTLRQQVATLREQNAALRDQLKRRAA